MDLVRDILLATERGDAQYTDGNERDVSEHIEMMERAGLMYGTGRNLWGLTWEGFSLLDAIRKESVWSKAKATLLKQGESWTFDLLQRWVTDYVARQIGLQ